MASSNGPIAEALDPSDPVPLHEQAAQIRRASAEGQARPGERLPPAMDPAVLTVNRHTVLRALRLLPDEGLVEVRRQQPPGRYEAVRHHPERCPPSTNPSPDRPHEIGDPGWPQKSFGAHRCWVENLPRILRQLRSDRCTRLLLFTLRDQPWSRDQVRSPA
jgi:DNA-binding transcriptional MocR family regulator